MSRIGKKPIIIPAGVTVEIKGDVVIVKGPKGKLEQKINSAVKISKEESIIIVTCHLNSKFYNAIYGTTRALIANMVKGVSDGFDKVLHLEGVGYRASISGNNLVLQLGFSHLIEFPIPDGINITVSPKQNQIVVAGVDKQVVGEIASNIRAFRKPEPYKGKGIRYADEHIKRKAGKSAGAGAGAGGGAGGKK